RSDHRRRYASARSSGAAAAMAIAGSVCERDQDGGRGAQDGRELPGWSWQTSIGGCDPGRHKHIVFDKRDVGGERTALRCLANPGEEERGNVFAGYTLALGVGNRLLDGGSDLAGEDFLFDGNRIGDDETTREPDAPLRVHDCRNLLRPVDACGNRKAAVAGIKGGKAIGAEAD